MATKFVEVKSSNLSGVFEVVANKGICWQVKDQEGDTFTVQKKHVVRGPWEEDESDEELPTSSVSPLLSQALAQVQVSPQPAAPAKRQKREKDAEAPTVPMITLKELCFDLKIIPRIARRRLRKALPHVGTGGRWEWELASPDLEKVKKVLLATPVSPEAEAETEEE